MCTDRITPTLQGVLDCVEATYSDCGATWFCRASIVAGTQVAWDDCCECGDEEGQLWVRVVDWLPDPAFPAPGFEGCQQPSVMTVGVGALRCVPTLDEQGFPPSSDEEAAAAARIYLDAQLLHKGVICCVPEVQWLQYTPLGYEGGCGGGEHLYSVPLLPCACTD